MIVAQPLDLLSTEIAVEHDSVSLWKVNLDWPQPAVAAATELLCPEERKRVARFHRARDQRRFVVARAILRLILGRYGRMSPEKIAFSYNEFGKPRLDCNQIGSDVRFNLAHSGEFALYAVAIGQDIGVDLEAIRPDFASMEIARRFFADEEMSALSNLEADDLIAAFFRCWTRKEAYLKATGLGLSMPLNSFVVPVGPSNGYPLAVTSRDSAAPAGRWQINDLEIVDGFAAALCVDVRAKAAPKIGQVQYLQPQTICD